VAGLEKRSAQCETVLNKLAPQGPGSESFNVSNWMDLDAKSADQISLLQKENKELSTSVDELKLRSHNAERKLEDESAAHLRFETESKTLKQQNTQLKADEESMIKTVKNLVQSNKVKSVETQAKSLKQAREELQVQFDKKAEDLKAVEREMRAKADAAQDDIKAAQAATEKVKTQMRAMQQKINAFNKVKQGLNADKLHLMGTLSSLMRQNTQFQSELRMCAVGGHNSSALESADAIMEASQEVSLPENILMTSKDDDAKDAAELASLVQHPDAQVQSAPRPALSLAQSSSTGHGQNALNHWLFKQPQQQFEPHVRQNFRGAGQSGDVLQQLSLLSVGWENHRVHAE